MVVQQVVPGETLHLALATESLPAETTFTVKSGAPSTVFFDPKSGHFFFTPTAEQAGRRYRIRFAGHAERNPAEQMEVIIQVTKPSFERDRYPVSLQNP